ncbi:hypothetical protein EV651_11178 [Kribbella sp. VKM Ac-2571]|nr:hypothetical protein EV651_11178 [Kribbella sp. VKM Ac-2571]
MRSLKRTSGASGGSSKLVGSALVCKALEDAGDLWRRAMPMLRKFAPEGHWCAVDDDWLSGVGERFNSSHLHRRQPA